MWISPALISGVRADQLPLANTIKGSATSSKSACSADLHPYSNADVEKNTYSL